MAVKSLFGTNGIRGHAKNLFTNEFCFDIGVAFGKFLKEKKGEIAVGMDPRKSSQRIKRSLLQGLSTIVSSDFLDEGIIPTPCLNYFIKKKKLSAGIMITGSHIDKELNGVKFFVGEEEISKDNEKEIEDFYYRFQEKQRYQEKEIKIKSGSQARKIYSDLLLELAQKPYPDWKIVVDASNGTQSEIIPQVLEKLGLKVLRINCNPTKELVVRDTEVSGAFSDLSERIKNEQADFGVNLDPDGDRIVFFDEKGNFIPGEYSCSLIAKNLPDKTIITPINTSSVVEHLGKKVIRTKVGVLHVVKAMKKHKAVFGFESNGGGISAEIFYGRDGGTTLIKMLNLMKESNQPLSRLVTSLPKFFIIKKKVDCPRELNKIILQKAEEEFKGTKIDKLDGLKIWFGKDNWILFRPSGNAPEFRVFAESKSKEEAEELIEKGINFVKKIIQEKEQA